MKSLYLPEPDAFIRWFEIGDGRPLVCLPGVSFPAIANFLDLAVHPVLDGRRMLMIDYLGSGLSDHPVGYDYALLSHAEAVAAILDHLGLQGADILGHSMGGSVGIALAQARPDLVGHLIVCEGNVDPGGGETTGWIAAQRREAFLAHGYASLLDQLGRKARAGSAFAALQLGSWRIADPVGLYGNCEALARLPEDFADGFFDLGMRRTFVYGEATHPDAVGAPTPDTPDPARLQAHGIGTATVSGSGHGLMLDNLDGFAEVLGALLR